MNKSTIIIGIIFIVLIIFGGIFFITSNKKSNQVVSQKTIPVQVVATSTPLSVKPTVIVSTLKQVATSTPKPKSDSLPLTTEFRAKVRSTFIDSCKAKVGQQYTSACNCAADYLSAHFTDTQLATIYVDYHSSTKLPAAVQAAYDACKDK
jgi:hypothetical protein